MYNPFSLEGKIILVAGASSGIGRAIALECSKMGASLIILGRNKQRLSEVFGQLKGKGNYMFTADINDEEEITDMVKNLPALNGIVHSVGIVHTLPFKFLKRDVFDNLMNTNFFSPVYLTNKIIRQGKVLKNGSIVFISSLEGNVIASPGNGMYCASKGALTAIAKALAIELASQKIRVNGILPGMVKTDLLDNLKTIISEEQIGADEKKYPLGYGSPLDIAHAAVYLLSDASKWVTGSSMIVDGGFTLL